MSRQSNKMTSSLRCLVAVLAICQLGLGCGTEVGNGHSGPPKFGSKKTNGSSGGTQTDESAPAAQNAPPVGEGSLPDAAQSKTEPPIDFKDLIAVVLNNCASPFATVAELSAKSFDYVPVDAAAKARLTIDATTLLPAVKLSIAAENGFKSSFRVNKTVPDKVIVADLAGKPFATPFECKGSVVVTDESIAGYAKPVKAHRAMLTNKDAPGDISLAWFIDGTNLENPLRRIEIKKENATLTLSPAPK